LQVENVFEGQPKQNTPFPFKVKIANNGGQEEDNTGTNLLVTVYTTPEQPVPQVMPESCFGDLGWVACYPADLAEGASSELSFTWSFSEIEDIYIATTVAGFENAERSIQQPDDLLSNNVAEDLVSVGEGGGSSANDGDNDGVTDDIDNCPNTANSGQEDLDGDNIGDACDNDKDGDEKNNDVDNCPLIANAGQEDLDDDGIGDACDDFQDQDKDEVADAADNCLLIANTDQADLDDDDLGDACDDDIDGDEKNNDVDNCPLVANPSQEDADFDQIGDACDDLIDTDGDGYANDVDNCPANANPDQNDLDQDLIGDACDDDVDGDEQANDVDNCPLIANPEQEDADEDGIGDACDSETDLDKDDDGYNDDVDNCPLIANPGQEDLDEDGIGDDCDTDLDGDEKNNDVDNCPLIANPEQEDADEDGIGDACDSETDLDKDDDGFEDDVDNCPTIANADQADVDDDGKGDACDADIDGDDVTNNLDNCPYTANNDQNDIDEDNTGDVCDLDRDGDLIDNELDNCPDISNADQSNFDGDVFGDVCDSDADGDDVDDGVDLFPLDGRGGLDNDNDGIADEWELIYGLDPTDPSDASSDVDGDGISALEEFKADTNPKVSDLDEQIISLYGTRSLSAGATSTFEIRMDLIGKSDKADGVGIRIHYNSLQVDTFELASVLSAGNVTAGADFEDDSDQDNDPSTDRYLLAEWRVIGGGWPESLPAKLADLLIQPSPAVSEVKVNITEVYPATGFALKLENYRFPIGAPSLDIDGDGTVGPLTDGLLVIRYLFGFRGDALIAGAVDSEATRKTSEEISQAIESLMPN
jgi:hypothetical protein